GTCLSATASPQAAAGLSLTTNHRTPAENPALAKPCNPLLAIAAALVAALGGCACPASGPWGPQTAGNQPRPSATQLTDASSTIDSRHPPSNDELVVRGQSPGYPQAAYPPGAYPPGAY